jgi:hypothetical protein
MSLINDALKRAKDAQHKSPPVAPGPQLRPAEPAPAGAPGRGMGKTAPGILILIALIGLFLLWRDHRKTVKARPALAKTIAPAIAVPESKPLVQTVAATAASTAAVKPPGATPPAAPAPAPLKLQAIFFNPGRSSAMISGKTVQAGDTVQGFHVTAINRSSATLVSATETNVMKLAEQ